MNGSVVGKRVAIVGGAGFIGHHLALRLQEAGAEPHILDSLQILPFIKDKKASLTGSCLISFFFI